MTHVRSQDEKEKYKLAFHPLQTAINHYQN